jgi:rhodanese-related sulfurtransferase
MSAPVILFIIIFLLPIIILLVLKYISKKNLIPKLIKAGATIIDVRTTEEFNEANNPNSFNIPLNDIEYKGQSLDKDTIYIVCCDNGTRSEMAIQALKELEIDKVYNAGAWTNTIISSSNPAL